MHRIVSGFFFCSFFFKGIWSILNFFHPKKKNNSNRNCRIYLPRWHSKQLEINVNLCKYPIRAKSLSPPNSLCFSFRFSFIYRCICRFDVKRVGFICSSPQQRLSLFLIEFHFFSNLLSQFFSSSNTIQMECAVLFDELKNRINFCLSVCFFF